MLNICLLYRHVDNLLDFLFVKVISLRSLMPKIRKLKKKYGFYLGFTKHSESAGRRKSVVFSEITILQSRRSTIHALDSDSSYFKGFNFWRRNFLELKTNSIWLPVKRLATFSDPSIKKFFFGETTTVFTDAYIVCILQISLFYSSGHRRFGGLR